MPRYSSISANVVSLAGGPPCFVDDHVARGIASESHWTGEHRFSTVVVTMMALQTSLFGHTPPRFDAAFSAARRHELKLGAWMEHQSGWLTGHETVFEHLRDYAQWQTCKREMYDRIVDVPRLLAPMPTDSVCAPLCKQIQRALGDRYGTPVPHVTVAYYRNGNDSVAWHGDRLGRERAQGLVATVSVGAPRKFMVREHEGPIVLNFKLGWGDLCVMGGTSQTTYDHAVPKVKHAAPRMVMMFRSHYEPLG